MPVPARRTLGLEALPFRGTTISFVRSLLLVLGLRSRASARGKTRSREFVCLEKKSSPGRWWS
jgi:hypothetical protein